MLFRSVLEHETVSRRLSDDKIEVAVLIKIGSPGSEGCGGWPGQTTQRGRILESSAPILSQQRQPTRTGHEQVRKEVVVPVDWHDKLPRRKWP